MPKINESLPPQAPHHEPFMSVQRAPMGFPTVSTIWSYATHPVWFVIAKVKRFFAWVFSWFSPQKQAPPSSTSTDSRKVVQESKREEVAPQPCKPPEGMKLKKIDEGEGKFTIQLFLKGLPSENKLFFQKNGSQLKYLGKDFKDPHLNPLMGSICHFIMEKQQTTSLITKGEKNAIDLCLAGIERVDEVSYQPTFNNQQNNAITALIEQARKGDLPSSAVQALGNIEAKLKQQSSSTIPRKTPYYSLPIKDLFTLRDALDPKEWKARDDQKPDFELKKEDTAVGEFEFV